MKPTHHSPINAGNFLLKKLTQELLSHSTFFNEKSPNPPFIEQMNLLKKMDVFVMSSLPVKKEYSEKEKNLKNTSSNLNANHHPSLFKKQSSHLKNGRPKNI